jgi:NTE family protein
MTLENKKFNLLLSGGAALGYAHIGVCDFLQERALAPYSYHGVSMGALVASVEALDISLEEKKKIYKEISSIFKWLSFSFSRSLISFKKIEKIVDSIFKNSTFKDISTPLYIGVTEYSSGEYISFSKENNVLIKEALLASIAVPALFPPVKINSSVFVDGYISSNLPLYSVDNDYINIVVNVTGKNSFYKYSSSKLLELSLFKNLERSIRILIYNQTKLALSQWKKAYILLEPELFAFKTTHFYKFSQIKAKGYKEAKKILV